MTGRPAFHRLVLFEVSVSLLLAVLASFVSRTVGYAVLLGGVSALLPSLYLLWQYYRQSKKANTTAKKTLFGFYYAVSSKFVLALLTLCLMLVVGVVALHLPLIPFIGGYAANQLIFALMPLAYRQTIYIE